MEVNNVGQNIINTNSYASNLNLSPNENTNTEIEVKAISQGENLSQDLNNKTYDEKELNDALKKIDNFLKDEHVHTEYSYHKEMKTMMIKVIDENTKEVILEIPPKKILDMVASMCKQFGLFDKKA